MILASTFLAASWQATLLALLPAAGFWCQWQAGKLLLATSVFSFHPQPVATTVSALRF